MGIEARDLGEAIDEVEDLIREMNRSGDCLGFIEQVTAILIYLQAVRAVSLDEKALIELLRTR